MTSSPGIAETCIIGKKHDAVPVVYVNGNVQICQPSVQREKVQFATEWIYKAGHSTIHDASFGH